MKILIFTLVFLSFFCLNESQAHQWSILVDGNYMGNFGLSRAMKGTQFNINTYPWGRTGTRTGELGCYVDLNLDSSNFSYFSGISYTYFSNDYSDSSGWWKSKMNISTLSLGMAYTFGKKNDIWNTIIRANINSSLIWIDGKFITKVPYIKNEVIEIQSTLRLGFEVGLGGRLNIPWFPLSIEPTINYKTINFLGRSTDNSKTLLYDIDKYAHIKMNLNDAKNPSDPNSKASVIDYLSLKLGIRWWL